MTDQNDKLAILGCGNIGSAIARGLLQCGQPEASRIYLTRRDDERLAEFAARGFITTTDNRQAVSDSSVVIIAVTPQQLDSLIAEIAPVIVPDRHVVLSVVSGASIEQLKGLLGEGVAVARVMPNTAVAIRESMTCISADEGDESARAVAIELFDRLGESVVIHEELMVPATALCACGIAFFMRAIRAASQGGIEIGFHAEEALFMAAQTAKGAASMIVDGGTHPESEVDKVTTPRGCTISGLNHMEHSGFSSSMIRGIVMSAAKAETLYSTDD